MIEYRLQPFFKTVFLYRKQPVEQRPQWLNGYVRAKIYSLDDGRAKTLLTDFFESERANDCRQFNDRSCVVLHPFD